MILVSALAISAFCACGKTEWILNEENFFFTMNNVQMFPERYLNNVFELDCYTYELVDVNGVSYMCGARHCSSGYGCTCGNDTIIGFVLIYDGAIPAPTNQSDKNSVEKTWIHVRGTVTSGQHTEISVYTYTNGEPDMSKPAETIKMPTLTVETLELLTAEEYANLAPYVTK